MEGATREITKLFIQCGISFNVADTLAWKHAMRTVNKISLPWEDPSAHTDCGVEEAKEAWGDRDVLIEEHVGEV